MEETSDSWVIKIFSGAFGTRGMDALDMRQNGRQNEGTCK